MALGGAIIAIIAGSNQAFASSGDLPRLIHRVAGEEKVDAGLLKAIVAVESNNQADLVSEKGAVGLMQLMPGTARALGVTNRLNPEQCLRGGARYIKRLIAMYPNLSLALAAYNAGPANVDKFGGMPPFPETKSYVRRVMARYAKTIPPRKALPLHTARRKPVIIKDTVVAPDRNEHSDEQKMAVVAGSGSAGNTHGPGAYGFLHRSSYLASRHAVVMEVMDRDIINTSESVTDGKGSTEVPIIRLVYN